MTHPEDGVQRIYYEIDLRNQSGATFDDLKVEYRFCIRLSSPTKTIDVPDRVIAGTLRFGALKDASHKMLKTKTVREFEETYTDDYKTYDADNIEHRHKEKFTAGKCSVEGLLVRIYGPSMNGEPTYRDVSDPPSLLDWARWDEERAPLENNFTFATFRNSVSKKITSLEEVRKRGRAETSDDYYAWMRIVYDQLELKLSDEELRVLIDGVRFFYDSNYDYKGEDAALIGDECNRREWFEDAIYWYEVAVEGGAEPSSFGPYKDLIRLYASSENPDLRNGPKAVEYGEVLLEADKDDPWVLDLLARAKGSVLEY